MKKMDNIAIALQNEMRCYDLHQQAILCYKNGDLQGAAENYNQILKLNPDDAVAHENLGSIINTVKGDPDEAINHLTKAIRLNPNNAGSFYNRGISYSSKDDPARAISDYTQVIRLKPDHAWAFYNRGLEYKKIGDYAHAFSDFSEAKRLDPNDVSAINQLAALRNIGYR